MWNPECIYPTQETLNFVDELMKKWVLPSEVVGFSYNPEKMAAAIEEYVIQSIRPEYSELMTERRRQDLKWGEQNHGLPVWMLILTEEIGEASQAVLKIREGTMGIEDFRTEIIQCGAVCVQILEYLSRTGVSAE